MQATGFVTDSVVETLDAVDRLYAVRTDAEAGCFELAAHFADQHSADSLPHALAVGASAAGNGAGRPGRWGGNVDHTHPFSDGGVGDERKSNANRSGQSRLENYGPLGRFHHRINTHGHWTVRQPFPGIYVWGDPHGQVYLTDHTGSHKVTAPGTGVEAATTYDPAIELHPADELIQLDSPDAG